MLNIKNFILKLNGNLIDKKQKEKRIAIEKKKEIEIEKTIEIEKKIGTNTLEADHVIESIEVVGKDQIQEIAIIEEKKKRRKSN